MKHINIDSKTVKISGPQIDSLRSLKRMGWVAKRSDFWSGTPRHLKFTLDVAHVWGVSEEYNSATPHSARVRKFFKDNPKCRSAIVGNPRRINAILKQSDGGAA